MKNRKLRKAAAFLFTFMLLAVTLSCCLAEDMGGEGTVIVVDPPAGMPAADVAQQDTQPFIPEGLSKADLIVEEPDDGVDGTVFGVGAVRVTVSNPLEYPYSAIAYMKTHFECGCDKEGTGFMVDRDRLLTAAHCLVCPYHGAWADRITFYFGYKNSKTYAYKYDGRWTAYAGNLFSSKEYIMDWDYGCVKLYEPVGDSVGWFGCSWGLPDNFFYIEYLYIAGYRDAILKYDGGYAAPYGSQHIMYTMDMQPGNSGGPVFTEDYHAVAINIAEDDSFNYGYRLSDYVMDELNALE